MTSSSERSMSQCVLMCIASERASQLNLVYFGSFIKSLDEVRVNNSLHQIVSTNPEYKHCYIKPPFIWSLTLLPPQSRNWKMLKQFIKLENSYGTFFISVLLVTIYMVSFGFDSFQRYLKQEVIIKKEIINQHFIDPPGIFNKT